MNYHLHQQGQNVGLVSLDELRQRRESGELHGNEFVWCEGMANWATLDSVLFPERPPVLPSFIPAPVAAQKKGGQPTRLILALVFCIVVGAIVVEVVVARYFLKNNRLFNPSQSGWTQNRSRPDAQAAATNAVTWTTNTLTEAGLRESRREFRVRLYLEGYKQFGERNPATDAEALRFLEAWIAQNFGGSNATNLPDVTLLADQLAANPNCKDTLILTIAGVESVEVHESIHRLDRAVAAYDGSRHKAYPKFYATVSLAAKHNSDSPRVRELDALALRELELSFTDGSLLPKDQADIAEKLIHGWAYNFFYRNRDAVCALPRAGGKEFEWLALVLEGEYHIMEAWKARGGGYSNTVNEQGWKGFRDHLAAARKKLAAAWELQPELPIAATRMIYVSLGDSDITEMRRWFDRAVAGQIDYPQAWSQMRWGLRPRWYGDYASMLAFGVTALNTGRFDTDVPRILYDSISDLESEYEMEHGEHIFGQEDVWPHLQKMYEGYIAAPSQAHALAGWRSTYATIAFLAGQYGVAREQLEANQWKAERWNRAGWGRDLSLMPLEVAARTSSLSNMVDEAETTAAGGDIDEAVRLYANLPTATIADERTREFIRERMTTLSTEQKLASGDWVDFMPTDDTFAGWNVERGTFKRLPDGALEVQSGPTGHTIYSRAQLGADFEVRGTFEVVSSSTKAFQAGLVLGLPELDSSSWYAFRMKRNSDEGEVISFSRQWTNRQLTNPRRLDDRTNTFSLRFRDGCVTASVNDEGVFKDAKPPRDSRISTNEFFVGFGAFNDMNDTVIRYRNVQVRELPPN